MRYSSVLAFAAAAPLLVGATQPLRLQPSSGWFVDYAEDSCRLIRTFGEGQQRVKLAFEGDAPGEMDMLIIGKPLRTYAEDVNAAFLPFRGSEPVKGRVRETMEGEPALMWTRAPILPPDIAARELAETNERKEHPHTRPPARDPAEKAARDAGRLQFADSTSELEIRPPDNRSVILETGPMGKAVRAFDKCTRDSLVAWGVNPDLEDRVVRPVWADQPSRWFNSSDYPMDLVMKGEESVVQARVLVDAAGQVTKCTSLSHFKAPEFNKLVCNNFTKRAHFSPAELADGTKVPSFYTIKIVFRVAR